MVNYTPNLDKDKNSQYDIKVDEIMDSSVITFTPETEIKEAVTTLLKNRLSGAPVLDTNKTVQGFLSAKDCLRIATDQRYYNTYARHIKDYMTTSVISLQIGASIWAAIDIFERHPIHICPIVSENNEFEGLIDRHHILESVSKMAQTTW